MFSDSPFDAVVWALVGMPGSIPEPIQIFVDKTKNSVGSSFLVPLLFLLSIIPGKAIVWNEDKVC